MSLDPLVLMAEVDRATERLLRTAYALDDAAVAGASRLPGWTRGHVLAHIARNADGLTNLLAWARTGVVTPQYPHPGQRERDIAAGAPRGRDEQIADVRESAERFAAAAAELPPAAWTTVLDIPGAPQPAARVVWRRLREVEVHHVDLGAGYTHTDWPVAFGHRLLHEVVAWFNTHDGAPPMVLRPGDSGHDLRVGDATAPAVGDAATAPIVAGTACALAAWLTGRATGDDLTVSPPGELPTPPAWI